MDRGARWRGERGARPSPRVGTRGGSGVGSSVPLVLTGDDKELNSYSLIEVMGDDIEDEGASSTRLSVP